jgi:hypothetical protein
MVQDHHCGALAVPAVGLAGPAGAQTHNHAAAKDALRHPPFFNDAQRAVVDRLADIIIPTDEQSRARTKPA